MTNKPIISVIQVFQKRNMDGMIAKRLPSILESTNMYSEISKVETEVPLGKWAGDIGLLVSIMTYGKLIYATQRSYTHLLHVSYRP